MKILIVNGFSDTPQGKKAFRDFENAVKHCFQNQKQISYSSCEFLSRDIYNLDDFLYEMNTRYLSQEALKSFDTLDFVFIDGDANLLPWIQKARKFLILMRMCKRTSKVMFACTFAMQMLVYLCASNYNVRRVVNGKGRGSTLKEIQSTPKEGLKTLTHQDVCLDSATGDIYAYDHQRNEFYPVANVGIHFHKAAQDAGSTMLKPYTYVPTYFDEIPPVYVGDYNEAKCRVFKKYIQHWMTIGIGCQEFLIPQNNSWDVHPINMTNAENCFTVLAESSRGPSIIIWKNAVATQFHIQKKYPHTFQVLQNFIDHVCYIFVNESDRVDVRLNDVAHSYVPVRPLLSCAPEENVQKEMAHCGYTFSNRKVKQQPLTVSNNATNLAPIQSKPADLQSQLPGAKYTAKSFSQTAQISKRGSSINSPVPTKLQSAEEAELESQEDSFEKQLRNQYAKDVWKTKAEIRAMLHPKLQSEHLPKRSDWVSGISQKNIKGGIFDSVRNDRTYSAPRDPQKVKNKIQRPYTAYNKYQKMSQSSNGKIKREFSSIRIGEQYVDPQSKYLQEQKNLKNKKMIGPEFKIVGKASSRQTFTDTKEVLQPDPAKRPVTAYKFREDNPDRWISGPFKIPDYNRS